MTDLVVSTIYPSDRRGMRRVKALLGSEGIRLDRNLDYTCAIIDDDGAMIATGSCFANTLRCLAVDGSHRGEGLLNSIVTHLMEVQSARGNTRVFVYTKEEASPMFVDLGFHEVVRVPGSVVFLENRRDGFASYLRRLETRRIQGRVVSAIVMNANPFSLGHRYLVEQAARASDVVHLFVVSEESSIFPFDVRRRLIAEGTADLPNVVLQDTDSYMVSSATFPSYFQRDEEAAIRGQALLDLTVFTEIARRLGITRRFVGDEKASFVTRLYNETMASLLPTKGIACVQLRRLEVGGRVVSASTIRQAIHDRDEELLRSLVPETTLRFLTSPDAEPIRRAIAASTDLAHY